MDCHICCENRKCIIDCDGCALKACKECCERYLLESHEDPHCMGCRMGWNRVFLVGQFSKTFVTKHLKNHREDVLLDREKSLLPSSQGYVDRYLHEKEIQKTKGEIREEIKKLEATEDTLSKEMDDLFNEYTGKENFSEHRAEYTAKKIILSGKLRACRISRRRHMNAISDINRSERHLTRTEGVDVTVRVKCPLEGCRGYLNSGSTCGICEKKVCKKCMEELVDEHTCDPNTVETLKAIKKESRACPGCGTMVSKIDGCDQMWCTIPTCHTAFSWRTGKQVTGHIHNPHYIQFQNEHAVGGMERNIRDVPCGGMPDYSEIITCLKGMRMVNRQNTHSIHDHKIGSAHMALNHIIYIDLPRFQVGAPDNGPLRARYLLKELNEGDLKKALQMQEKKRAKMKAFGDVLAMCTHTMSDIFRNILHVYNEYRNKWVAAYERKSEEGFDYTEEYNAILTNAQERTMSELKTFEHLVEYTAKHLREISSVYQCVIPQSTVRLFEHGPNGRIRRYDKKFPFDETLQKAFIGIANESLYTLNGKDTKA